MELLSKSPVWGQGFNFLEHLYQALLDSKWLSCLFSCLLSKWVDTTQAK